MACLLLIPVLLISIGYQPKSSFKGSLNLLVFPGSSAGKESACNAGDPSLSPGLGRSSGEGIGYPLQYSWASLLARMVRISLQWGRPGFDPWVGKIPWRRAWQLIPVFLPRECMDRGAWWAIVCGWQWIRHDLATNTFILILDRADFKAKKVTSNKGFTWS